jgi:hypothetical protein
LALFVLANLIHLGDLYRLRRGDYLAALEFIADQDTNEIITIGSNRDHGTSILIDFYRQRMRSPREIQYCRAADWGDVQVGPGSQGGPKMNRSARYPNWLILHHDPTNGPANYQKSNEVDGRTHKFSRMFDAAILSGWQRVCYRLERHDQPPAAKFSREMVNVVTASDR